MTYEADRQAHEDRQRAEMVSPDDRPFPTQNGIADAFNTLYSPFVATNDNTGGHVMVLFVRRKDAESGPESADRTVAFSQTDTDGFMAVLYNDWSDADDVGEGRMYGYVPSGLYGRDADREAAEWLLVLAYGWLTESHWTD
jgi:hypothetical protein